MPSELLAKDVSEFLALVTKIAKQWFPEENGWGPWFRGHSDADWELTPNLYRGVLPKRGLRIVEMNSGKSSSFERRA